MISLGKNRQVVQWVLPLDSREPYFERPKPQENGLEEEREEEERGVKPNPLQPPLAQIEGAKLVPYRLNN